MLTARPLLRRLVHQAAGLACRDNRKFASTVQAVAYDSLQPHVLEQQLLQQATPLPVVVTGAMHDWPARSWSAQHLQQFGNVIIPVEISHNGGDYRDLHAAAKDRRFEADVEVPLAVLLDSMQAGEGRQSPVQLYAAQVDLISLIPELKSGIRTPPLSVISERLYKRNTWLGPAGTATPLHCDPYCNMFCQVWGSKYVRMYDHKHAQQLYPFTNPFLRNTSQVRVDMHSKEYPDFPGFSEVPYFEHCLQPGEMLFIPKKYWHFVQALDVSWSVSYWWT